MAQYRYVIIPTAQYTAEGMQMRAALELLRRTNMIGAAMAQQIVRHTALSGTFSTRGWHELQNEIVDLLVAEGVLPTQDGELRAGTFAELDNCTTISIQTPEQGGVLQPD